MRVPLPGKSAWPELLGKQATLAVQTIAHERPDLVVKVLPPDSVVTQEYNPKRVRVHVDEYSLVSWVPVIG